ncbi:hypothetical protein GCM10027290_08480 [Micromonospora sonneratiae]|uniref:DUF5667 domain-containing protein n=1 Tax=Micromonospora sonneratiae TaxID=1184706 RepID=A0ABW3YBN6_9ACTN
MRSPVTDRRRLCPRGLLPLTTAVLFTLTAAVLFTLGPSPSPAHADGPADDAAVVFCLSRAERPRLVDAAVALGLATPGSTPERLTAHGEERDVEGWRRDRRADFDRACRALVAARQHETGTAGEKSSGFLTLLLPALISGAVGWFFSAQLATAGTRRVQADALRAAIRAFVNASEGFVRQQQETRAGLPPDDEEVHTRRAELAAGLDQVASAKRWWRLPERLSEDLYGDTLGPRMTQDWFPLTSAEKDARAAVLRASLGRFSAEAEQVAQAVQSSGLPRPRMWRR